MLRTIVFNACHPLNFNSRSCIMQGIILYYFLIPTVAMAYCNKQLEAKILWKQSQQLLKLLENLKISYKCLSSVSTAYETSFLDCTEIYNAGYQKSGVYIIRLLHRFKTLPVYCDMTTVGNFSGEKGWISIQERLDGTVSFDHGWRYYVEGFGFPDREHWIGLQNIRSIVRQKRLIPFKYQEIGKKYIDPIIQTDTEDWDGIRVKVEFLLFYVTPEQEGFRMPYRGCPDFRIFPNCSYKYAITERLHPFVFIVGQEFETRDHNKWARHRYNKSCVKKQTGGWWFGNCHSNLNGGYPAKNENNTWTNMFASRYWKDINPKNTALRRTSMMLQWIEL